MDEIYFKRLVFAEGDYFWLQTAERFINIIYDRNPLRSHAYVMNVCAARQDNAAREIRERTREPAAKPKRKPKLKPETVNLSFYRHKQESGTEPPFRRLNRGAKEEKKTDEYVKNLEAKFENIEDESNDKYIEALAMRFGIESDSMEKRRKLKEMLAKIEPEVEFTLL